MTLGLSTALHNRVCVQDIGLSGATQADGLAVGRPSGFVGKLMEPLLDGCFTLSDRSLMTYMSGLWRQEEVFVEPSAAAGFAMPHRLGKEAPEYLPLLERGTLIVWATGGSLMPRAVRNRLLRQAGKLSQNEK